MRRSTAGPATLPFLLIVSMALAVACGGGSAASPADPGATGGPGDTPAASEAAAPTQPAGASEPAGEPPAASDPTSGGPAGGVCELATTDEVGGVFGTTVTATVIPGPPDTCMVENDAGAVLVSWVYNDSDGAMLYDLLTTGARAVPGLGDKAAHVENTGLLVLKGDGITTITISGQADLSQEEGDDAAEKVAAFIAGRM